MRAEIDPDRLALLSVCRAANALEQATADPRTWFFIILDLHRALYAALIAALSAFAFDEAYGDKLRSQWKEFLEKSRTDPNAQPPTSNRVPSLCDLIAMAEAGSSSLQPLQLTQEQRADIKILSERRHRLEHVKPEGWTLYTTDMPRIGRNVAAVIEVLFEAFNHHLGFDEIDQANSALGRLKADPK